MQPNHIAVSENNMDWTWVVKGKSYKVLDFQSNHKILMIVKKHFISFYYSLYFLKSLLFFIRKSFHYIDKNAKNSLVMKLCKLYKTILKLNFFRTILSTYLSVSSILQILVMLVVIFDIFWSECEL